MELPPEVVSIIRDFSKPLLSYPAEYKEALLVLEIDEWAELKAKLSSKEADEVVTLLNIYIEDYKAMSKASDEYGTIAEIVDQYENEDVEPKLWAKYKRLNSRYKLTILKMSCSLSELIKRIWPSNGSQTPFLIYNLSLVPNMNRLNRGLGFSLSARPFLASFQL